MNTKLKIQESMLSWIQHEFDGTSTGDKRLDDRLKKLANQFMAQPQAPINQACENSKDIKAAYRFFQNEKVTAEKILESHQRCTVERASHFKTVFLIQDSAELDYTHHPKTKGCGKLNGSHRGLMMHSGLLISPTGGSLGLIHQSIWSRKDEKKIDRHERPIEEKESFKWIECLHTARRLLPTHIRIICLGDRENDLFEFFTEAKRLGISCVIRAQSDRGINKSSKSSRNHERLWPHMRAMKADGNFKVEIYSQKEKTTREANIEVAHDKVLFHPPKTHTVKKNGLLPSISLFVVHAREVGEVDEEKRIDWMLLSDMEVSGFVEAMNHIIWYTARWHIENWHKTLKSGCKVEDCRLDEGEKLIRYLTLKSILAWRIYWTVHMARGGRRYLSALEAFSQIELDVLFLKVNRRRMPKNSELTMEEAIILVARLGGYLNRKNDPPPGMTVIWRGWTRMMEAIDDFMLFQADSTYG